MLRLGRVAQFCRRQDHIEVICLDFIRRSEFVDLFASGVSELRSNYREPVIMHHRRKPAPLAPAQSPAARLKPTT